MADNHVPPAQPEEQGADSPPQGAFQPNMYPIMFWALAYGAVAAFILFIVFLLSQFITIVWFPVFLAGLIWGGYRNYQKQKQQFYSSSGTPYKPKQPIAEFREAVGDIVYASQKMAAEQAEEDAALLEQQLAEEEALLAEQEGQVPLEGEAPAEEGPAPRQQPPTDETQTPPRQG